MDENTLMELLRRYRAGALDENELLEVIRRIPYEGIGDFAMIDHHRSIRQGAAEVIYCPGKSSEQIVQIAQAMLERGSDVLATRADESVFKELRRIAPETEFFPASRAIIIQKKEKTGTGSVLVISAGTSDIPVAEEAKVTATFMGSRTESLYDVGVAGIHRLLANFDKIRNANVLVVVAGMDGALPSVVGGLVSVPVIAVPTSIGYGANFGGLAPLLTMLNSCAVGVGVVNIDNGFGAGALAHRINNPVNKVK